jgi:hypothetical protein
MKTLTTYRVTYDDGWHYVTSMAQGFTLNDARAYFIGQIHTEECDVTGKETRRRIVAVDPV